MQRDMFRLALLGLFIVLALPAPALAETARSAQSFTQSVGVNTHLGYSDTVYWKNWPMVRDRLKELGVSHIRDGTFPAEYPDVIGPTVANRYRELNGLGIKGNLLVGTEQAMAGRTSLADRLGWIKTNSLSAFVIGLEGDNEAYIGGVVLVVDAHDQARIDALRAMQCDIWNRVKGDAQLAGKTVVGPSGGPPFYEDDWYFHVAYNRGTLASCMDVGSLHPFPGTAQPHLHQSRDLDVAVAWAKHVYGDRRSWVTENGYWNAGASSVSEATAGVYVPRMAAELFRRGFARTQFYELIDINTGSSAQIDTYGLLRTDGTAKPAYTRLKTLMALTADSGTAVVDDLGYAIVCMVNCHSPIRHVLLKHSDGTHRLAFWLEAAAGSSAQDVELRLDVAPGRVDVYSVSSGTSPTMTDTSRSKVVRTSATDGVRMFKITPAA